MAEVVAWLESAEGQEWSRTRNDAALLPIAEIRAKDEFSAIADTKYHLITAPNAAHDPCGRPPLRGGRHDA